MAHNDTGTDMPMEKQENSGKAEALTIITTHVNADFDATASMLAAHKLYPGSKVIFPGSQEKNIRNFMVQSLFYLFNMVNISDIDFDAVTTLVLVDTRQPGRIGALESLLDKKNLTIHIYDHHPDMDGDIQGDFEIVERTGSTVAILAGIIKEKNIPVSPDEATIMCLGIYEDTGSFTYPSTTEKDFLAAAFLLSKGANLDLVADMMAREFNPEQISLLNDMFDSLDTYVFGGVSIAVSIVATEKYFPDLAFLVQKMMKMESLNALFVIARMENKVHLVARSRIPDVDVGAVVKNLGGGGHTFAASATIKDKTPAQVEQELLHILKHTVWPGKTALDLMSSPAICVDPKTSCRDARVLLTRYNINAALVTEKMGDETRLLGYITRQVISKTQYLQLDDASVREFMNTEIQSVAPDSDLSEIQKKIIEYKQRILPVVEDGVIKGVVTRTDLLNILASRFEFSGNGLPKAIRDETSARSRNINRFMEERLSEHILNILRIVGGVGARMNVGVYVVGGFVRDLFLYRKNEDLDIVVEGDGIAFAKAFAADVNGRINAYAKFGTAVVVFPDGFKVDVASARMEHYRFPGDLPIVEMSSIKIDLLRRDFTINTLAIQLNPEKFGTLIDFFSAQKDIKEKAIRILHNLSFVEDPTRVFRAIRFEQRFGFTIGKLTSSLLKNVVKSGIPAHLSGRRVFTELRLILEEENPKDALKRMQDYDLLKFIHPDLKPTKKMMALFNSVKKVLSWYSLSFLEEEPLKRWMVYFMALTAEFNLTDTTEICERLALAPKYREVCLKERFRAEKSLNDLERFANMKNSDLYNELTRYRIEIVLFMMSATKQQRVKKRISNYMTNLRHVKPSITGDDLIKLNIIPGPIFREILQAVLQAKLNGKINNRTDEINFARNYVV